MLPSTSIETAEVHSSKSAYLGLETNVIGQFCTFLDNNLDLCKFLGLYDYLYGFVNIHRRGVTTKACFEKQSRFCAVYRTCRTENSFFPFVSAWTPQFFAMGPVFLDLEKFQIAFVFWKQLILTYDRRL